MKENTGSTLDRRGEKEGKALKRVIAWQLVEAMKATHISRREMAKKMATSRTQIARLFDPENDRVQLDTIQKAAAALGKRITITFEDMAACPERPSPSAIPAPAYCWDFVFWVRHRRPRGGDVSENTLECVAQLVERILEGKKALPKQLGRNPDPETMWLCFHMLTVVPFPSARQLPISIDGFNTVGSKLNISEKAVGANYYKALNRLKAMEGWRGYIKWLNHREKRWEAYQASLERREPSPREYAFSLGMICLKREESGEESIASLSSKELDSLVREAEELYKDERGKEDYENWFSYRKRSLHIPTARRKRQNV